MVSQNGSDKPNLLRMFPNPASREQGFPGESAKAPQIETLLDACHMLFRIPASHLGLRTELSHIPVGRSLVQVAAITGLGETF